MEFLVVPGLLFWLFLVAFLVSATIVLEYERPEISGVIIAVGLLVLQFCSNVQPFTLAFANPMATLFWIVIYFFIGAAWGAVKWTSYVYSIRDKIRAGRDKIKEIYPDRFVYGKSSTCYVDEQNEVVTGSQGAELLLGEIYSRYKVTLPVKISDNKGRLIMWMTYWPLSGLWTVLNDPIRRGFNAIYNRMSGLLQSISDYAMKDVLK